MLAIGMSKVASPRGETDAADAARMLGQPESLIVTVRSLISTMLRRGLLDPDVDDCTQEVFRRALEGQQRLAEGRPVRPWVLGIARHVALDWQREKRRAARETPEPTDSDPQHRVLRVEPSGYERLEWAERRQEVSVALQQLPTALREALWLFHVEGRSYREIALRLSVPVGTVGTWILRGREQLATILLREDRK